MEAKQESRVAAVLPINSRAIRQPTDLGEIPDYLTEREVSPPATKSEKRDFWLIMCSALAVVLANAFMFNLATAGVVAGSWISISLLFGVLKAVFSR
ncbi:MAG: hypothetical protein AAF581_11170 [Planctomycetota bacterium]